MNLICLIKGHDWHRRYSPAEALRETIKRHPQVFLEYIPYRDPRYSAYMDTLLKLEYELRCVRCNKRGESFVDAMIPLFTDDEMQEYMKVHDIQEELARKAML